MDRRRFFRGCVAGGCALIAGGARLAAAEPAPAGLPVYPRTLLVDGAGQPLRTAGLTPNLAYAFRYPYASTPGILLDMGRVVEPAEPTSGDTRPGGVGPGRSIVAYVAICPHEWSHPEPAFSPIRYVAPGEQAVLAGNRDRLIVCCSHGSVFDPAAGGKVLQNPARVPLASIVLQWEPASDGVAAIGVRGQPSFEPFFALFDRDHRVVEGQVSTVPLTEFSKVVGRC